MSKTYDLHILAIQEPFTQGWSKYFSENALLRMHWAARNRFCKQVYEEVAWACKEKDVGAYNKIRLQLTIWFPKRRRRDRGNYAGGIQKLVTDGLVRAGVIPDDTDDHLEETFPILTASNVFAFVNVEITVLDEKEG